MKIYQSLRLDYKASNCGQDGNFFKMAIAFLTAAGFRAAVLYRIGNHHWENKRRIRAAIYTRLIRMTCHMDIEIAAKIGPGICFPHTWGIVIGGLSSIGRNCKIMQGVSLGGAGGKKNPGGQSQPYLGDGVFVGAGAKILGPVTIGDGAKIGANAVVVKDVPAGATAIGIPAVVR
jgi:serine O-acetyltransferase